MMSHPVRLAACITVLWTQYMWNTRWMGVGGWGGRDRDREIHTECVCTCVLESLGIPKAWEFYDCSKTDRKLDGEPDNSNTWRSNHWFTGMFCCFVLLCLYSFFFLFFSFLFCIPPLPTHSLGQTYWWVSSLNVVVMLIGLAAGGDL